MCSDTLALGQFRARSNQIVNTLILCLTKPTVVSSYGGGASMSAFDSEENCLNALHKNSVATSSSL